MLAEHVDYSYYNQVSLVLLMPLFLVFLMCMVDLRRTKFLFRCLFSNSYFYRYPYDVISKISFYQILIFLLNSIVFACFLLLIFYDGFDIYQFFFKNFRWVLCVSAGYFIVKHLLSELLYNFSNKKSYIKQMYVLETSYLMVVLLTVFILISYVFLHLNNYGWIRNFIIIFAVSMYFIRFVVLLSNNKNLLSSKVLFIILYLCTLEIVPFIYLFKSYTE